MDDSEEAMEALRSNLDVLWDDDVVVDKGSMSSCDCVSGYKEPTDACRGKLYPAYSFACVSSIS